MSSLKDHQSGKYAKILLGGDSGTGKTGCLASLVKAGYKLRILDYDNGLDVLAGYVRETCPELIETVEFRTLRDKRVYDNTEGFVVKEAKTWTTTSRMLNRWKYGDIDLGAPASWGPDCILVLDSLSRLADAAFDFFEPLTPVGKGGDKDGRAAYYAAQQGLSQLLAMITSDGMETNVIVCAHIRYIEMPDGTTKGFPRAVGQALSPDIPTWFNTLLECQTLPGGKKQIKTFGTGTMDLKNPRPFAMRTAYPLKDGMAKIMRVLTDPTVNDRKEEEAAASDVKPADTTPRRKFA